MSKFKIGDIVALYDVTFDNVNSTWRPAEKVNYSSVGKVVEIRDYGTHCICKVDLKYAKLTFPSEHLFKLNDMEKAIYWK